MLARAFCSLSSFFSSYSSPQGRPSRPSPPSVMIVVMDQMQPWYARAVRHEQRPVAAEPRRQLQERLRRRHGLRDRRQSQRHGQRPVPEAHGVVRRGHPRRRTTCWATVPSDDHHLGDLAYDQLTRAHPGEDYPKLGDYLHAKFPGTIVANVGEKGYQVESMAASSSDICVRMGSKAQSHLRGPASRCPGRGNYRGPRPAPATTCPPTSPNDSRLKISAGNQFPPATRLQTARTSLTLWNDHVRSRPTSYPEDGRYVRVPTTRT